MTTIDASRIATTLENIEHVGTCPTLWSGLFGAFADEEVDVLELVRQLEREPTVCAQVLRLANSAFYCRGKRIDTVAQAVMHLGLDMTRRIVLAVNLIGLYPNRCNTTAFDDAKFWKHTLAGAFLTQAMAASTAYFFPVQLYIAALLRDVGVLILRQYFPDVFANALKLALNDGIPFNGAVEKICGLSHRYMSMHVAIRWNLPETILGPLREDAPSGDAAREGRLLIRIADRILFEKKYEMWDPNAANPIEPGDCLLRGIDQPLKEALFAGAQRAVQGIAEHIVF